MTTSIPVIYKPLFGNDYLYYVFYGGRGGGKTENIAQCIVILSLMKRIRILCIRESQSSLSESVKATIEKWINELNVEDKFKITGGLITAENGSEIMFMGMRSHTAVNVKSINNVNITWIEEAEAFSKRSWNLLVPSVIRTPDPKIIISFNPYKDDDIIYSEFIGNTPPARSYIKYVNYYDNPFFKGSILDEQRKDDKERISEDEYNHKWLGKLVTFSEDSVFKDCKFEVLDMFYNDDYYVRKVIACDPATTDKEYSNEYGIVVVGKTVLGMFHIIDDFSGNYTPLEFSQKVVEAKNLHNVNNVVVEVNNGGDFIKAVLIQNDPTLNIVEVRAGTDKVQRATPVANLMSIGKVKFVKTMTKLVRQMRLMTYKGFKGSKGESPDRLDALVWGIYELAEIKTKDSIYTLFKPDYTKLSLDWLKKSYIVRRDIAYLYCVEGKVVMILLDLYRKDQEFKYIVKDSAIYDKVEDLDVDYTSLYGYDNPALQSLIVFNRDIIPFTAGDLKNLDDLTTVCLPIIKKNVFTISPEPKVRKYMNSSAFLLGLELMEFKLGLNKDNNYLLLQLFCYIIIMENNIT